VNKQISEAWAKTEDAINKQIATLDEQMQNELQRAMNLMGGKLASLSEKFVSDYTPLTERLREVVSLARV
jgi:conjugal transfer/entry exclusion protein